MEDHKSKTKFYFVKIYKTELYSTDPVDNTADLVEHLESLYGNQFMYSDDGTTEDEVVAEYVSEDGTQISGVLDSSVKFNRLTVLTHTEEVKNEALKFAEENFSLYTLEELQEEALKNLETNPSFLTVLGYGSIEDDLVDRQTEEIFRKALSSPNEETRIWAVISCVINQWYWQDMYELLVNMSKNDPSEEVRQNAQEMVEFIQVRGGVF